MSETILNVSGPVGSLSEVEVMGQLLPLIDQAKDLTTANVVLLPAIAKLAEEFGEKIKIELAKASVVNIDADRSIRAVGHVVRNRIGVKQAEPILAAAGIAIPKILILLSVVAIAAVGLAAIPREPMPINPIAEAAAAMSAGDYVKAESLWKDAADQGNDYDLCMGRRAESIMRQGRYDDALAACKDLDEKVESSWAPMIRGQVQELTGQTRSAWRFSYQQAAMRGNGYAICKLRGKR